MTKIFCQVANYGKQQDMSAGERAKRTLFTRPHEARTVSTEEPWWKTVSPQLERKHGRVTPASGFHSLFSLSPHPSSTPSYNYRSSSELGCPVLCVSYCVRIIKLKISNYQTQLLSTRKRQDAKTEPALLRATGG